MPDQTDYTIVVTTPSHPDGVRYPTRGESKYTRDQAIEHLRGMVKRGRPSDWINEHGAYAESSTERFTLEDIDGEGVRIA